MSDTFACRSPRKKLVSTLHVSTSLKMSVNGFELPAQTIVQTVNRSFFPISFVATPYLARAPGRVLTFVADLSLTLAFATLFKDKWPFTN